ncbi:efflux RND transporter permease subunit [Cyanobacterium aponinum AL20118]|uniref:Efflux RND transporter permease subunit n=2 Tax=Cyanobacterium aponinum TaxID=379064 RepID=A0A844GZQ2_9CHRO|nr:efflux RND transporter permease subunit [Cyanobacterium aponinum]MTF40542.1 efflux RND transporter permease subunit [Cyanobacterium aponinum 0216]WPF90150.1 efflux RND transporter permease subunit [Cyanobacterium aponinum AL20115]
MIDFFIKRPVFSSVTALIILFVGLISLFNLPLAQFPEISPVQIQVTANYDGASAEVVENAVTTVLERQINGTPGLRYITSSSSNSGTSSITATFASDVNQDLAAVDVQNRVSVAEAQLPESVQRNGVSVTKQSNNILLGIGLYSEDNRYDNLFMSNYADLYLVDPLKRINGVADVTIFGERRYAMRLWLDPEKLSSRGLTTADVIQAVSAQNNQIGAGKIGAEPVPDGQEFQIDLRAVSQLTSAQEFENLLLKTDANGALVRFKDVGRVELGAEDYSSFLRYRRQSAVGLGIYQLTGSNALEVAKQVKTQIEELSKTFPPGLKYEIAFDTTLYVQESLREVVNTLFMAVFLVILIILVFLQNWRTTLIPAVTIPLSLIGTFAFVKVFDFSINSLTLFGLTLATGMVVDDAIVVVEQIDRYIEDKDMSPFKAAQLGMKQLTGAVIATSLVLMAVFVPVAFFPGTTGALYRQFALTIAFSIAISTFLALTLTPSLCALLLRHHQKLPAWLQVPCDIFNGFLDNVTKSYRRSLVGLVRMRTVVIAVFVLLLAGTGWLYITIPQSFLPEEDQGYFITIIQAPEGVSLQYTSDVMEKIEKTILEEPEVQATFGVGGFAFSGNSSNSGVIFTPLKPWAERRSPEQSAEAVIGRLWGKFAMIPEARIIPLNPPAIRGLGSFGGFTYQLQDLRSDGDINSMMEVLGSLLGQANQTEGLTRVFTTFTANSPELVVDINRNKAQALNVNIDEVFRTLQTAFGSSYVNDFSLQNRTYRVYVQADGKFRTHPDDIKELYVRSANDTMIPLSNLATITPSTSPQVINHYNLFRSIEVSGSASPGASSGDAIAAMETLSAQILPRGFGYQWSGQSLEEIVSGGQAPIIFGLGLLFVFLVLAALYENYIDPLIILLAVPLAILGALLAQMSRGFSFDVYSQIGLVMLIGLASKNSILIVEFANQLRNEGLPIVKAAIEASQARLRPILMTAFSTLLGILPLAIATGAGSASRQSLGTVVFGGMLVATFLSLFVVPIVYIVIKMFAEKFVPTINSEEKVSQTP